MIKLIVLAVFLLASSWQSPPSPSQLTVAVVDSDGVAELYPTATGSSFFLSKSNPNSTPRFGIDQKTVASRRSDPSGLTYWNLPSHPLSYASGGTGWTSRLYIYASGGTAQKYTWLNQPGYLYVPADVKNQEETVYVRAHGLLDAGHAGVTLKVRGGAHASNGDLAACVMFELGLGRSGTPPQARFGKELHHPDYDWVKLTPAFSYALTENKWVGLKMVSYSSISNPKQAMNEFYLDIDPFDSFGKPKNGWRLFATYKDIEGLSTGRYSKLVNWGGWQTTVRSDGWHDIDFAFPSVREVVPR